jgi:hypothetical protein
MPGDGADGRVRDHLEPHGVRAAPVHADPATPLTRRPHRRTELGVLGPLGSAGTPGHRRADSAIRRDAPLLARHGL